MGAKPNYGKGLYDQLQEVMVRLDSVEKANKKESIQLTEDISVPKKVNQELQEEKQQLRNDNARLKSIINHDSSNTEISLFTFINIQILFSGINLLLLRIHL